MSSCLVPTLDVGLVWDATNLLVTGVLAVTEGLAGDYNQNGMIDAADYTVWRDILESSGTIMPNDPTPGFVDETDFAYWRAHFGDVLGGGAGTFASVPEPSSMVLAWIGMLGLVVAARRTNRGCPVSPDDPRGWRSRSVRCRVQDCRRVPQQDRRGRSPCDVDLYAERRAVYRWSDNEYRIDATSSCCARKASSTVGSKWVPRSSLMISKLFSMGRASL